MTRLSKVQDVWLGHVHIGRIGLVRHSSFCQTKGNLLSYDVLDTTIA